MKGGEEKEKRQEEREKGTLTLVHGRLAHTKYTPYVQLDFTPTEIPGGKKTKKNTQNCWGPFPFPARSMFLGFVRKLLTAVLTRSTSRALSISSV